MKKKTKKSTRRTRRASSKLRHNTLVLENCTKCLAKDMCGIYDITRLLWSLEGVAVLACFRTRDNFFRAVGRMAHDCQVYKQAGDISASIDNLVGSSQGPIQGPAQGPTKGDATK